MVVSVLLTLMSLYTALACFYFLLCFMCWGRLLSAAGEVAKDEKHLTVVEKIESDFVLLVVKFELLLL